MPNFRGSEWLIILLLIVLLFGAKRLPDAARGIGRSLRIFKAETKGLVDESKAPEGTPAVTATPEVVPPAVQAAAPAAQAAPVAPAPEVVGPALAPLPPEAAPVQPAGQTPPQSQAQTQA